MEISNSVYMAEQSYIGCILYEPELMKESKLGTFEVFSTMEHSMIFRNLLEMNKNDEPIDLQTLTIKMVENKSFDVVVGRKGSGYLSELALSIASVSGFQHYGDIILQAYRIRQSKLYAQEIIKLDTYEGAQEVVYESLSKIENVLATGVEKKSSLKETLVRVYDRIESGQSKGIPTGYTDYDRLTLGFHKGDLIIIGARPSMGKTAFALNMAQGQVDQKDESGEFINHVHIFSLEMEEDKLVERMLSAYGRIDSHRMRTGELTDEDWNKLTHALGHFGQMTNLDIHDQPSVTVPQIREKVRQAQREYPDRNHIVYIDYLQLLTYHGRASENNQTLKIGEISKELKKMARELNVPVCALSQLSRSLEQRQDKRPIMSDIRESGNIEQDADVISFLYRDDYYDKESENKDIIEIITAKQRNGATGNVSLAFVKQYNAFLNLERRFN